MKSPGKETQLSLPITCNSIEKRFDKLLVNSELGTGSEFIVILPLDGNQA